VAAFSPELIVAPKQVAYKTKLVADASKQDLKLAKPTLPKKSSRYLAS